VDRTDIVRVFVDVPEREANFVRGVELRLIPEAKSIADIPTEGADLAVLARLGGAIHFRIFDSQGKMLVGTDETRLSGKEQQVDAVKNLLANQWDPPQPSPGGPDNGGVWDKIPGAARQVSPILKAKVLEALATLLGREKVPAGTNARVLIR